MKIVYLTRAALAGKQSPANLVLGLIGLAALMNAMDIAQGQEALQSFQILVVILAQAALRNSRRAMWVL
jgi:hypothetical protein